MTAPKPPAPAPQALPDPPEVDEIAADVVRRLRGVLAQMPEEALRGLARSIAWNRHRWNQQEQARYASLHRVRELRDTE